MPKFIKLEGGPWHGEKVEDEGGTKLRLGIATKWEYGMPATEAKSGFAVYEPSPSREIAFWLGNTWDESTHNPQNP